MIQTKLIAYAFKVGCILVSENAVIRIQARNIIAHEVSVMLYDRWMHAYMIVCRRTLHLDWLRKTKLSQYYTSIIVERQNKMQN